MKQKRQRTKKRRPYYRKPRRTNRGNKRQRGGFLNRYDFAYAGRDTVNQAAKVTPGVIKAAAETSIGLQSKGSIKSFQKVVQKWKECFPKY